MKKAAARRGLQIVAQTLFLGLFLFLAAGRLDWGWGWAYVGVGAGILLLNDLVVPPEVAAERGRVRKGNVPTWDRALMLLFALAIYGTPVVAGLDVRHGWTPPLGRPVHAAGLVLIGLGQGLFTWAMASNRFFSTMVRLQDDRDHAVIADGPYRAVRHPGYAGTIVSLFATAAALGSWWAVVPAGLGAGLLVLRTALEDRTLRRELVGYEAYARRVCYRLVPGIW